MILRASFVAQPTGRQNRKDPKDLRKHRVGLGHALEVLKGNLPGLIIIEEAEGLAQDTVGCIS